MGYQQSWKSSLGLAPELLRVKIGTPPPRQSGLRTLPSNAKNLADAEVLR